MQLQIVLLLAVNLFTQWENCLLLLLQHLKKKKISLEAFCSKCQDIITRVVHQLYKTHSHNSFSGWFLFLPLQVLQQQSAIQSAMFERIFAERQSLMNGSLSAAKDSIASQTPI